MKQTLGLEYILNLHLLFLLTLLQAKRQQRKLNFLITQTELYAHFMSGKASVGGPEGDTAQEEILRKLEDTSAQRQIDIGGGVMVNAGQEDYGTNSSAKIQGLQLNIDPSCFCIIRPYEQQLTQTCPVFF